MKKIDWYIIRKFLGTFVYAITLIIVIAIIFDISEKIDDFLEKSAPLKEIIFTYYLNFIPYFINLFVLCLHLLRWYSLLPKWLPRPRL